MLQGRDQSESITRGLKDFLEAGKQRRAGDTVRAATQRRVQGVTVRQEYCPYLASFLGQKTHEPLSIFEALWTY